LGILLLLSKLPVFRWPLWVAMFVCDCQVACLTFGDIHTYAAQAQLDGDTYSLLGRLLVCVAWSRAALAQPGLHTTCQYNPCAQLRRPAQSLLLYVHCPYATHSTCCVDACTLCCRVFMSFPQRMRTRLLSHFQHALEACDVIMTPATPTTAPVLPPQANTTGAQRIALHARPVLDCIWVS
jgi:hypothetical protein